MMAFPGMIASAAAEAGMKVPADPDGDWSPKDYPHFKVFCNAQLCRAVRHGEHWDNAKIIAAIPDDKIRKVTLSKLLALGLEWRS